MYDPMMPEIVKSDFDREIAILTKDKTMEKYVRANGPEYCRLVFLPKIENLFWDCLLKYVDNDEVEMYINNNTVLKKDYTGGRVRFSEPCYPEFDNMYIRINDYLYRKILKEI